ncbi:MAG: TlpA family protein disulfide reductase [Bacteroidia bacterium]|nr:TlpA family protein disulfide reductase [Bacteroidia bacterium]
MLLGLFSTNAFSQSIKVIKITELESRIKNNSDTTYIVNFWATWCAPCVKELPDFDSISKVYASQKVKVLLVSLDFKEDLETKVIPFVQKKKIISEVMLLDESNANYFIPKIANEWTGALPATYILNNKKKTTIFYEKKLNYEFIEQQVKSIESTN